MTIYKYPVKIEGMQRLQLPKEAVILSVKGDIQGENVIYALVNPDNELEERIIFTYGTGHNIEGRNDRTYIGTYTTHNTNGVWHVFIKN